MDPAGGREVLHPNLPLPPLLSLQFFPISIA